MSSFSITRTLAAALQRGLLICLLVLAGVVIAVLILPILLLVESKNRLNGALTRRRLRALALRSNCPLCGAQLDLVGIRQGEKRFSDEEKQSQQYKWDHERQHNLFITVGFTHYRNVLCSTCGVWLQWLPATNSVLLPADAAQWREERDR